MATLGIAILMVTASLVWWRLARRWWSILHLKFKRMNDLESKLGFEQNSLVDTKDREAIEYRRALGSDRRVSLLRRLGNRLWYQVPSETYIASSGNGQSLRFGLISLKKNELREKYPLVYRHYQTMQNYEYRGIKPVLNFFILVNISLWIIVGAVSLQLFWEGGGVFVWIDAGVFVWIADIGARICALVMFFLLCLLWFLLLLYFWPKA